jgi:hypothetical protein
MLELILVMREITGRPQIPAPTPEVVTEQVAPVSPEALPEQWDPDRGGIRYFPLPE